MRIFFFLIIWGNYFGISKQRLIKRDKKTLVCKVDYSSVLCIKLKRFLKCDKLAQLHYKLLQQFHIFPESTVPFC